MVQPVPGHKATTAYRKAGPLWSLGYHTGTDFAAPSGKPIVSAAPGKVVAIDYSSSYGWRVTVESKINGTTVRHYYCHMPSRTGYVDVGKVVTAGQRIGTVGATGNVTGPHLHLEARVAPYAFSNACFRDPSIVINWGAAPAAPVKTVIKKETWKSTGKPYTNWRDEPNTSSEVIKKTTPTNPAITTTAYQERSDGRWVRRTVRDEGKTKNVWARTDNLKAYVKPVVDAPAPAPVPVPVPVPAKQTVALTVASFNVAAMATKQQRDSFKARVPKIGKVMDAAKADVLAVQEAGDAGSTYLSSVTSAAKPLARAAGGGKWRYVFHDSDVTRIGSGLINLPKATLLDGDQKQIAWLAASKGGVKFLVVDLHLEHEDGDEADEKRPLQAVAALRKGRVMARSLGIAQKNVIVAGDTNSHAAVAEAMEELGWVSAAAVAESKTNADLRSFNGFAKTKTGTSLDYIFVHESLAVASFTLIPDHTASDHNLIVATIELEIA